MHFLTDKVLHRESGISSVFVKVGHSFSYGFIDVTRKPYFQATFTATAKATIASVVATTLQTTRIFWSSRLEFSEWSTKNDAATRVLILSAIRLLPADEPLRQPPRSKTKCVKILITFFVL